MACIEASGSAISYKDSVNTFTNQDSTDVNKELCRGNPIILKVPSISSPANLSKAHFVLATGATVDADGNLEYIINDPNSKNAGTKQKISLVRGYRLYRPTFDPAMIFIHITASVDMVVTDPAGRRTGYNPFLNQSYSEIPGARFIASEAISDPSDEEIATTSETRFEGLNPDSGVYKIQIFAKSDANYQLTSYSFDSTGTINGISDRKAPAKAGTTSEFYIQHSAEAIPVRHAALEIEKTKFSDSSQRDKAYVSGRILPFDGRSIVSVDKYISIKVGEFSALIRKKDLVKSRSHGQTYYKHVFSGRDGGIIELNVDTGEFTLFVRNVDLDDSKPQITTDISVQIDDVFASGLVTFDNKHANKGK